MGKVALVSRDVNQWDLSGYTQRIAEICDEHDVETILYSLHTLHLGNGQWATTHDMIFGKSKKIKTVILEAGNLDGLETRVEVWHRHKKAPDVHYRYFAKSSDDESKKEKLVDDFDQRVIRDQALLICGELNVVKTIRGERGRVEDQYQFVKKLKTCRIGVILAPAHTAMKRYECADKKRAFSQGRTVISVWSKDHVRGYEPHSPWQVFANGKDLTNRVEEIQHPIKERSDIRIGIF